MEYFKLSEVFLEGFKGRQPKWGYGALSYFTYKRCVEISTPVLCADLTWKPAGELQEGQDIIGFDDYQNGRMRHMRFGKVIYNKIEKAPTVGIELEDGSIIYATPDHRWLTKLNGNNRLYWKESQDLANTKKGNPIYLVRPLGPTWNTDSTYEGGFLSAAFDGEGCFDRINSLSFIQVDNPMLQQVESFLNKRNVIYKKTMRKLVAGRQPCFYLKINSRRSFIPLLGSLRPPRLMEKFFNNVRSNNGDLGALRCQKEDYIKVVRVFDAGERDIAVLSTDLATHFTAGFASHNTYARNVESENRTEEFWETLQRVIEGVYTIQKRHCTSYRLTWDNRRAQRSAQEMFQRMWDFKFLPPGRGLWAMGTKMIEEKGSAALNNCGFVSTKNIKEEGLASPFCWAMDMLMLGVGIGFDTKGAGFVVKAAIDSDSIYVIPDTREGWVESVQILFDAFHFGRPLPKFDYSKIRLAGSIIKGFGGVASGPEPLKKLHESLTELLRARVDEELSSVDIVDLMNFIGRCVVAGNVRRSAEIAIGQIGDYYFITCKDPSISKNEEAMAGWRWASNNSLFVNTNDDLSFPASITKKNGEPGYIFDDMVKTFGRLCDPPDYVDADYAGMNPCVEQVLESYELCNVVEQFPANHDSPEDFWKTVKCAYLYAKSVALIPTHDPRTNAVMLRNRRIGLSQSGIEQAKNKFGSSFYYRMFCDAAFKIVLEWDKTYSRWLCVPMSKRHTSVKPSGTVSLLAGAFPGVHSAHAEYYLRSVRVASNSPLVKSLLDAGYRVEPALTDPNGTMVVYFPIHEQNFRKSKAQMTIWEQLNNASMMQRYWADNSVSVTISFQPHEADDIPEALEMYRDKLKAVSFMPFRDHGYKQPPYGTISKDEYEEYAGSLKELQFIETLSDADRAADKYCQGETCEIPK